MTTLNSGAALFGAEPQAGQTPLPYKNPALTPEARVEDLLARMTLEEKLGQLTQGCVNREEDVAGYEAHVKASEQGSFILGPAPEASVRVRNHLQKLAVEETRLGIPLLFGFDTIHGYRTVFPIPLGQACSWEPTLVERTQAVAAKESKAAGLDWVFAPMSDIASDARWGRVAESFGEDPFLTSAFVPAAVRGFQGDNPGAPDRVAATLKHFVGYGASFAGREYNETYVTPFALRNFHLPPFEAGVRAGAETVMSSFNANDGLPNVSNAETLNGVLRGEWKFPGFVVSDWESVVEAIRWGYAATPADAARQALAAGNDMEMFSTSYRDTLGAQVRAGRVTEATVEEAVRRVLRTKFRLGLFEKPYGDESAPARVLLAPESLRLAREAASKSLVLLKNDGVLPLSPDVKRLALVGPLGDDGGEMLGTWAGWGQGKEVVTLAAALREHFGNTCEIEVVAGVPLLETGERTRTLFDGTVVKDEAAKALEAEGIEHAVEAAKRADVVLLAVGEPRGWSGENASRTELGLTGRQQALVEAVAKAGKPVVAVVFSGRPLVLAPVASRVGALVQAWHPGVQAGPGIVDVLTGAVAPTGHLTISFPRSVGQVPVFYNHLVTGRPHMSDYKDSTREPYYPFGYGLTYTTFDFGPVTVERVGEGWRATAIVRNTGKRAGEALAQLYVQAVACRDGARPVQELRGWSKKHLEAGEQGIVSFELGEKQLGFVRRDGTPACEPGTYRVWIAPHAGAGVAANLDWAEASHTDHKVPHGYRYHVDLPTGYAAGESWPVLVCLHGSGECGDDLAKVPVNGPSRFVAANPVIGAEEQEGARFVQEHFIVVSPQCPVEGDGWKAGEVIRVLDEVLERWKADRTRVYATGLSLGGYGAWDLAFLHADRFAAVVPISGGGNGLFVLNALDGSLNHFEEFKTLGIRAYHGRKDDVVVISETLRLAEPLAKAGFEVSVDVDETAGHGVWNSVYAKKDVYEWLLRHRRLSPKKPRE